MNDKTVMNLDVDTPFLTTALSGKITSSTVRITTKYTFMQQAMETIQFTGKFSNNNRGELHHISGLVDLQVRVFTGKSKAIFKKTFDTPKTSHDFSQKTN